MRISDWSSDVCSSDLLAGAAGAEAPDGDVRVFVTRDPAGWTAEYRFAREAPAWIFARSGLTRESGKPGRRPEARRGGKECVRARRSRRSASPETQTPRQCIAILTQSYSKPQTN